MVGPQKLDEQVVLAAEIRVERAPRVARRRGDILHAGRLQSLPGNQLLGCIQQPLRGLLAAVLPAQTFAVHGFEPSTQRRGLEYTTISGYSIASEYRYGSIMFPAAHCVVARSFR